MAHRVRMIARSMVGLAALGGAAMASPAFADNAADIASLKALVAQYNANYKARDAEKLVASNAPDLISYLPNSPVAIGPGDAKTLAAGFAADPALNVVVTPDRIDVAKSGDLAYIVGHAEQTATNPNSHAVEHSASGYIVVFRRDAGAWKAVAITVTPGPPAKP